MFKEAGIPHVNQTAFRKAASFEDAISATQEAIAKYLKRGNNVFMCMNDLQKAFDSVEYPLLLNRLQENRSNGEDMAFNSRLV